MAQCHQAGQRQGQLTLNRWCYLVNNLLKNKLTSGEVALCMGLRQSRTVDIAPLVQACGFDALYVDMEHSPVGFEIASAICIAAMGYGVTPLVRVPGHLGQDISRALDGGAQGVILPHVNTPEQAAAIVSFAKYPPLGHRSVMGAGPASAYRSQPLAEINRSGNADTMVIIMLETPEGVANAHAIAAVPGVDMLLIGSNDLCTEMGIPGQLRHPDLLAAYQTVAKACHENRIALGVGGIRGDADLQMQLIRLGARFLIAGSDTTYLSAAASKDAGALRELIGNLSA